MCVCLRIAVINMWVDSLIETIEYTVSVLHAALHARTWHIYLTLLFFLRPLQSFARPFRKLIVCTFSFPSPIHNKILTDFHYYKDKKHKKALNTNLIGLTYCSINLWLKFTKTNCIESNDEMTFDFVIPKFFFYFLLHSHSFISDFFHEFFYLPRCFIE